MTTTAPRPRRLQERPRRVLYVGLVMIVLGALGFYFALTKSLPFLGQGGRLVTAYFKEPNQVQAGNTPVRVDGIDVGTVSSVTEADGGRYGRVVLRITDSNLTLHTDATAALQFRTLLGANFVVNLNPGSSSAPELSNNTIPLSHTSVQTELDDILKVFNNNTSLATRTDLKQLSASMSGSQLKTLVQDLAPTLAPTATAFNALRGEQSNDLSTLVSSASQTVHTLAADRSDLETLVSGGASALGAVSGERQALASALQEAPTTLDSTVAVSHSVEATLPSLNTLLTALGPGARELGPAAAATQPTVRKLRTVLDRVQPLLTSLRPAISDLSAAATPGDAVLTGLGPTLTRLNTQLLPWLDSDDSDLKRPIYELIAPTLASLGSAASEYDDNSHVIHFPIQPELNSLTIVPCTLFIKAPTPGDLLQCASLNSVLDELLGATTSSSTDSASRSSK
jgi:virulence factor Mce-like protein